MVVAKPAFLLHLVLAYHVIIQKIERFQEINVFVYQIIFKILKIKLNVYQIFSVTLNVRLVKIIHVKKLYMN